jgi:DNA-binding NarL/FixJ family response regulator
VLQPLALCSLIVEDNPTDVLLLQEALSQVPGVEFTLHQASRLAEALDRLENEHFDVALVDLGLPDSTGLETLRVLHQRAPDVPKVILTGAGDEEAGVEALQMGAQDYVLKSEMQSTLLPRVIRYALERQRLQKSLAEARDREAYDRELCSMERLSRPPGTSLTAEIYAGSPLEQSAPQSFLDAVCKYETILEKALERRIYKAEDNVSEQLRELSRELGFLRVNARDVIEIYSSALNKRVANRPLQTAQWFMDEGRVTVLELMGYLVGYYRRYYLRPETSGAQR